MQLKRLAAVILALAVVVGVAHALSIDVTLPHGPIRGFAGPKGYTFLGIPYAAPPVGPLRFSYPEPPAPWTSVLDATVPGAACPQRCVLPPHTCPNVTSEDCLNLNVFAPAKASEELHPVMVFIHGGRFEQGGAGLGLYNGITVANHSSVVVVTFNYRLGALGYSKTKVSTGNYGLRDQRTVLQWVRDNIHLFGGDNSRVLLYGQSAGAASTASHLVSPLSEGLFHRAIVESDPLTLPMYPDYEADKLGERFAKNLGCSETDMDCLRSKSVEDVLAAQYAAQKIVDPLAVVSAFMPYTPNWSPGSVDLPQNPFKLFLEQKFHKIPVAFGTMENDCTMFIYMIWNETMPWEMYDVVVGGIFLLDTPGVYGMYKNESNIAGGDYRPRMGQLGTDYIFTCPNRATISSTSLTVPTYNYVFNHVISVDVWGPRYPECRRFVCHGSELPFIFDTGDLDGFYHWDAEEEELSVEMMTYWGNMAYSGNPNVGPNTPKVTWPKYDATSRQTLEFRTGGNKVMTNFRQSECDHYDKIGYGHGAFNKP